LGVFWLLRELASVALGETTRPAMIRTMSAMLVVVGLMTAMQQAVRPATPASTTPNATTSNPAPRNRQQSWEIRNQEPRIARRTRMRREDSGGDAEETLVDTNSK